MNRTLANVNCIALAITIIINYLSNTGFFNNSTMSDISGRYENYFTPAGYAFSIWGLIYLSLLAFVIYQIRVAQNKVADKIIIETGPWFIISCFANCMWIIAWLNDYLLFSVVLMFLLLISILTIIHRNNMELQRLPTLKKLYTWWPFAIYAGWVSVASIANIAAFLTKIDWNGFGIGAETWTIIMILIAGALNVFVTWNRHMPLFSAVGIWALMAIAFANDGKSEMVYTAAIAVSGALLLNIILKLIKKQKSVNAGLE